MLQCCGGRGPPESAIEESPPLHDTARVYPGAAQREEQDLSEEPLPSPRASVKELAEHMQPRKKKTKELLTPHDCPYPGMIPEWIQKDHSEQEKWGPARKCIEDLLRRESSDGTNIFDMCIGIIIVINIIFMIPETDLTQVCKRPDCNMPILTAANSIFLTIYTIEVLLRAFTQRGLYIFSPWNILDLFIVVAGFLGFAVTDEGSGLLQNVSLMRIARVLRVIRVAKLLNKFATLNTMIQGFSHAMAAMAWGLFLILILLIIFSILAVELMNETNKTLYADDSDNYCATAFSTVVRSTLLFFQTLVAGDSWGACAIPIIERMPMTFALFAIALVCIQLGFTNLVLAVIVDKAAEVRQWQGEAKVQTQKEEEKESLKQWGVLMAEMDQDESGTVTLQEMLDGFEDEEMKMKMDAMKIDQDDMKELFMLMDRDSSGTLEYDDFIRTFHKANTQEPHIYCMMMKLEVTKIRYMLQHFLFPSQREQMSGSGNNAGKKKVLHAEVLHQSLPPADSKTDANAWTSDFASSITATTVEDSPGRQVPSSLCISQEQQGLAKTFKRDSCCGGALPQACSGEAPAETGPGQNLSEELRGLRNSLEARLDALAGEAAEIANRLSSQHVLLEDFRRSSEAIARAVMGEEIEDHVSAVTSSAEAAVKPLAVGDRRAADLGSAPLEGRPRSHDVIAAAFERHPAAGAHLSCCRPEGRTAVAGAIQGQRARPTAEGR